MDIKDELVYNLVKTVLDYSNTLRKKAECIVEYNINVGPLELKKAILGYEIFKLKRTLDISLAYLKKNEEIEHLKIDETVKFESEDLAKEIDNMKSFLEISEDIFTGDDVSLDEYEQIEDIYLKLIRRYYPILNNDLSDESQKRFNQMQEAFINLDLALLKNYLEIDVKENNNIDDLELKLEIERLEEEIVKINNEFPCNLLNDGVFEVGDRIQSLNLEIEELLIEKQMIIDKIEEIEPVEGLAS